MKAGIDIFYDGKSISDTVDALGRGTIRIEKVPSYSTIEIATTYADQNVLATGDRAMYSAIGKATQTITVTLIGNERFIDDAVRKINDIIFSTQSKKLVFGDEADWYYMARVNNSFVPEISTDASMPTATGTITFTFDDPKAFSNVIREIKLGTNSDLGQINKVEAGHYVATVNNPNEETDLEITINTPSENGYLGVTNGDAVFQMGDINGSDKKLYTITDAHTDAKLQSLFDSAIKNKGVNVASNENTFTANLGILNGPWGRKHIYNPMSGRGSITIDLGDDSGTKSEYLFWRQVFWAGRTNQMGAVKVLVSDQNGKLLYGVETLKDQIAFPTKFNFVTGNADGTYNILRTKWFKPSDSYYDNFFNKDNGWCNIQREENKIGFSWRGTREVFNRSELKGRRANKLHIIIDELGKKRMITHAYVDQFKFRRTDSSKISDVTNLFGEDTTIKLESKGSQTTVNGRKNVSYNARGSKPPRLLKGENTIDIELSDWITKEPEISLKYRERRY